MGCGFLLTSLLAQRFTCFKSHLHGLSQLGFKGENLSVLFYSLVSWRGEWMMKSPNLDLSRFGEPSLQPDHPKHAQSHLNLETRSKESVLETWVHIPVMPWLTGKTWSSLTLSTCQHLYLHRRKLVLRNPDFFFLVLKFCASGVGLPLNGWPWPTASLTWAQILALPLLAM